LRPIRPGLRPLAFENRACALSRLHGLAPFGLNSFGLTPARANTFTQTTARHPLSKAEGRCEFAEDRKAHRSAVVRLSQPDFA
jgi:hypothetical protein